MSPFIKKLKEIKKETFRLTDFYVQELVDLFDFKDDEDKNFILGNDKKSSLYEGDILQLLKALLKEKDKLSGFEDEIIENYKNKYLANNSSIRRDYCLVYLELFIDVLKTKDFKSLFRELYSISYADLIEKFTDIFRKIGDKEYFVKSFNVHLEGKTKYGNKYLRKTDIKFLLNLDTKHFINFIDGLSSDGLVYLKELNKEETEISIKKLNTLGDSNINNRVKVLFFEIINKLSEKESHSYEYKQTITSFIKSEFASKLAYYLGNIYTELSLDVVKIEGSTSYSLWEIISMISSIIRKENIKELCELLSDNYIDVYVYENIEGGARIDKKELLDEFKKYESFNKKYKERLKFLKKTKNEQEKYQQKERGKFDEGIKKIIEDEENNPKGINEYLLYQYEESDYEDFKKDPKVVETVKNQVKRFFELPHSDPEKYELHYTEKSQNGSSYKTHQFVGNNTFIRCLKFYKEFGFEVTGGILKKAIKYVPFAYSDDLEHILAIVGGRELEKEDVDYLLSVYDGTRTKDDLRYNNISTFTLFYEKYKSSFIKHAETETQETFIKIINDTSYSGYERKYTAEKLAEIGEEKQLLDLFKKYKTDENYFLKIIGDGVLNTEKNEFDVAIISSKALIKRFPNTENKKAIIDWYIEQLRVKVPLYIEHGDGMHGISGIESELSWDLNEEKSFISIFRYINDLAFENDIKELLYFSFQIIEESRRDYGLFGNYIQQAVFNFYEGLSDKKLKIIFEIEKEVTNQVKDDESRILFKINHLDKLLNIYSEKVDKLEIHRIYKSVYHKEITKEEEIIRLENTISFLEKEKEQIYRPLIITEGKTDWKHLKNAISKLPGFDNLKNDNLLFHEFENGDQKVDGSSDLENLLKYLGKIGSKNIVIGVFDRDEDNIMRIHKDEKDQIKKWGNNVFSFCIPIPKNREKYNKISIEFYYTDEEIKTICSNKGTRLFFSNEIEEIVSKNQTNKKSINIKYNILKGAIKEDEHDKKIFDDNIDKIIDGEGLKIAHSKNYFAESILKGINGFNEFNLGNFQLIFEKIEIIIEDSRIIQKS